MPRAKKTPDSAPVAKKTAAPKKVAKKAVKAEPVQATPAPAPVAEAPAAEVAAPAPPALTEDFTAFMAKLQQVTSMLSTLRTEFRQLEKKATRELKAAQKASAKRKRKAGNRSPSGFVKPTLISNELAAFLGKDKGTEMARTQVTREINSYIRAHNLQDPKNGRRILADTKLRKLLKLTKEDELTYFNLQRYMSPHFAKATKKVDAKSS